MRGVQDLGHVSLPDGILVSIHTMFHWAVEVNSQDYRPSRSLYIRKSPMWQAVGAILLVMSGSPPQISRLTLPR